MTDKPDLKLLEGDANVHWLQAPTRINLPTDRVLEGAAKAKLNGVVVIGWTADGEEYFASSLADAGDILWLLARLQHTIVTTPERVFGD